MGTATLLVGISALICLVAYDKPQVGFGFLVPRRRALHFFITTGIELSKNYVHRMYLPVHRMYLPAFSTVRLRRGALRPARPWTTTPPLHSDAPWYHQAKQIERSNERTERMSRMKEVAIGQHTEDDVRSAVAKLTEVVKEVGPRPGRGRGWSSICFCSREKENALPETNSELT